MAAPPEVGMSFARDDGRGLTETEVPALMKVLMGVDPHKASFAVAAVDERVGELLERPSFPQSCAGLRALEAPHCNVHSFSLPPLKRGRDRPRLELINVPSVKA